jgi:hypothetical protein
MWVRLARRCLGRAKSASRRQPVWIGVDVGWERADTAVVWIGEVGGQLHVGAEIWFRERAVLNAVDCIHELAERYHVQEVAFDRGGRPRASWRWSAAAASRRRTRSRTVA